MRERRYALDDFPDCPVDTLAPGEGELQLFFCLRIGGLPDGLLEAVVTEQAFGVVDPCEVVRVLGYFESPGLCHRMLRQQLGNDSPGGFVPVGAPRFGKQVREFLAFAYSLGYGVETEIRYQPRAEALAMLDSHRIKGATVRIDADKELVLWLKFLQKFCRVNIV